MGITYCAHSLLRLAPVNFYLDNVTLYVVPEPAGLSLLGLGTALFLLRRRS